MFGYLLATRAVGDWRAASMVPGLQTAAGLGLHHPCTVPRERRARGKVDAGLVVGLEGDGDVVVSECPTGIRDTVAEPGAALPRVQMPQRQVRCRQ